MITRGDILPLTITHLAGLGDGVAQHQGVPVFVPLSCAGDTVRAEIVQTHKEHCVAHVLEVLHPSAHRTTPPCSHFGLCGGCSLQHLNTEAYREFKQQIAEDAAHALGMDAGVMRPAYIVPPASRRRAEFKVTVEEKRVILGFLASRSHQIVNVIQCKVVDELIMQALPEWQAALQRCKKPTRVAALHITLADTGTEVILCCHAPLKPADKETLRQCGTALQVQRLGIEESGQDIQWLIMGEPHMQFGGVNVELPPAAFLQATPQSQRVMTDTVLQACGTAPRHVADIYCGIGTFSLPLAQTGHRVWAYEGNSEAVTALFNAARRAGLENMLMTHQRDLYASPLTHELEGVDIAVINPPRNGALPQCRALAQSAVQRVIMVSCNPATFIRDGKALIGGGFMLESLFPVDQFLWSHHLELVGIFSRVAQ